MTKKLLAIVLAAIMVFTTLAIPTFAADATITYADGKVTVTWLKVTDATRYSVVVLKDGTTTVATLTAAQPTADPVTVTTAVSAGGTYTAQVVAYKGDLVHATLSSNSVYVPVSSTGTATGTASNLSVAGTTATTTTVTFKYSGVGVKYAIEYVIGTNNHREFHDIPANGEVTFTISEAFANVKSVTIYEANPAGTAVVGSAIGTWTNTGAGTSGGTTGGTTGGTVTGSGFTYNLTAYGATQRRLTLSWTAITGATHYRVNYKIGNAASFTNGSPVTGLACGYTLDNASSYEFKLQYSTNGGSTWNDTNVTLSVPANTTSSSGGSGNQGTTGTTGTLTINQGATAATVSWAPVAGASSYMIAYTINNTTTSFAVSTNSATIPATAADRWSITVYAVKNGQVAELVGSYNKTTGTTGGTTGGSTSTGTTYTKSEIQGLTATKINNYTTRISWNKTNAYYYIISYGLLGSNGGETKVEYYNNYYDIPYGLSKNFQVYVTAVSRDGKGTRIGYAINVASNPLIGSTTTIPTPEVTVDTYVANLTAKITSDDKVSLAWDDANDAEYYTVYYKRSTATEWTKINTKIYGLSVNIKGLDKQNKSYDYDFRVEASNGLESGIVTIEHTKGETAKAKNPSTEATKDMEITSVTSSKTGTIVVNWLPVEGATSYKIYVAEGNSNTYKLKATVTGTTATITGLKSGVSYKVRGVGIPYDESSLSAALKKCELVKVTVK